MTVTTGLTDDSYTEIASGALAEGDPVIVGVMRPASSGDAAGTQQRPPGFNMGGGGGRRR